MGGCERDTFTLAISLFRDSTTEKKFAPSFNSLHWLSYVTITGHFCLLICSVYFRVLFFRVSIFFHVYVCMMEIMQVIYIPASVHITIS